MTDETKTGLDNPTPVESPSQKAEEAAEVKVDNIEDRIRELEGRLTSKGRNEAKLSKDLESAKSDLEKYSKEFEKAKEANRKWQEWYLQNHASPEEKQRAHLAEQAENARKAYDANADVWKEIAKEDDPRIKKALVKLAESAERAGESVSKFQIRALKDSFDAVEDKEEEKDPPKVSGARNTGAVSETFDQKLAKARAAKDSTAVMNLLAERELEKRIAKR